MVEPLFGSNPLPPGLTSPGFGWFQLPLSLASRPPLTPGTLTALPNVSLGPQTVVPPISQEVYGYGNVPQPATFGFGPSVPAFSMPEIGTVQGLLALVAMRRGQQNGPTTDNEIEEFIYDALEFLPGSNDVEVRCEAGRATLTGSVPHKRLKRDVGEIAWAIPAINDVQNNVTITARRRRAQAREAETPQQTARKQG
jgi:BON domain